MNAGLGGGANLVGDVLGELLQAVGHAHLGFGDEVQGPEFQRAQGDLGTPFGQGGDHDHGHGTQLHQARQEIQPIHLGHFHVQGDDVGVQVADHLAGDERIGRGAHADHVRLLIDDLRQQAPHQGGIVNDHDTCLCHWNPCSLFRGCSPPVSVSRILSRDAEQLAPARREARAMAFRTSRSSRPTTARCAARPGVLEPRSSRCWSAAVS